MQNANTRNTGGVGIIMSPLSSLIDAESFPVGIVILDQQDKLVYNNEYVTNFFPNIEENESLFRSLTQLKANDELTTITINDRSYFVISYGGSSKHGNGKVNKTFFILTLSELERFFAEQRMIKDICSETCVVMESSYDGIYVANEHGYSIFINKAYEKLTGAVRSEVIGKHVKEISESGVMSHIVTELVLEKKITITDSVKCQRTNRELVVTGNPVFKKDGTIWRVVVNLRDITELETLKTQLFKTQALSEKYYLELSRLRLKAQNIIFKSIQMKKSLELALRVSLVDSTVLIQGESGVGKELIAELIYDHSSRKNKPFVKINCGAIPENLLESELFGYESGAFSGAKRDGKPGLFEVAEGGVILLDEISEMPLNLQVKMLRVLQKSEMRRVGATNAVKVNVRIIAITNKDLTTLISENKFREDLYYRLNVVPIQVPPLRERKEDIPLLIAYFLQKFNTQYELTKKISSSVIDKLILYNWPGNVRELENIIERLVVTTPSELILKDDLPEYLNEQKESAKINVSINEITTLREAVEYIEKELLSKAMSDFKSMQKAAEAVGVDRTTVLRKIAKYNITY